MENQPVMQFNTPGSPIKRASNASTFKSVILPSLIIMAIIVAGIGTGWFLSNNTGKSTLNNVSVNGNQVETAPGAEVSSGGNEVGVDDTATFRDNAQGTLEDGGIDGEGTHHLTREGGPSKNVYLTSSIVDLDEFIGKKVEVWGETIGAKKAGWLMDVGRVKVIE